MSWHDVVPNSRCCFIHVANETDEEKKKKMGKILIAIRSYVGRGEFHVRARVCGIGFHWWALSTEQRTFSYRNSFVTPLPVRRDIADAFRTWVWMRFVAATAVYGPIESDEYAIFSFCTLLITYFLLAIARSKWIWISLTFFTESAVAPSRNACLRCH